MKIKHLLLAITLTTVAAGASAADFTVGGISYNIISVGRQTCEVTNIGGQRYYTGDIVVPEKVVDSYDNTEYTVIAVGQSAFSYCEELKSVTLPNTIQQFKKDAFGGAGLESLTIPTSCKYIGESCFWGAKLKSITIPGNVDTIQNHAFRMCKQLTSLTLDEGVKFVGAKAFTNCETLTDVKLPQSLNSIGDHAFQGCEKLASIVIPDGIENYGGGLFEECPLLTDISVAAGSTRFMAIDGVLFSKDGKILYEYPFGKKETYYYPDEKTEQVWDYAFEKNSVLTSIKLGAAVRSIGAYTFNAMENLTDIDLGGALETIGEHAFMDCQKVKEFNFPPTLRHIASMAISRAYGITKIVLPNSVESLGDWAFFGCENVPEIRIGSGLKTMAKTVFQRCYGVNTVYCEAMVPPVADGLQFQADNYAKSTLHVPAGTKEAYAAAEGWKEFSQIVDDLPASGIEGIFDAADAQSEYFTLDGRRISEPEQGTVCIRRTRSAAGVETHKVIIR